MQNQRVKNTFPTYKLGDAVKMSYARRVRAQMPNCISIDFVNNFFFFKENELLIVSRKQLTKLIFHAALFTSLSIRDV